MPDLWPPACLVIGAGAMGQALMQGWRPGEHYRGRLLVSDVAPRLAPNLSAWKGLSLNPQPDACGALPLVVLAVKPQHAAAALAPWRACLTEDTILVSVMAGAPLASLARWCAPQRPHLVRCMPNLPSALGAGALVFCALSRTALVRRRVEGLFAANGLCQWLPPAQENLLHAVTALSGSGPAYVYYLAELLGQGWAQSRYAAALQAALAAGGAALGLSARLAARLARATLHGAAAQLAEPQADAAALRRAVTSPQGTTEAALQVLADDARGWPALVRRARPPPAFRACVLRAMRAAAGRSRALAAR
ncbi:MAG: NAD(P)-binding domain-containing protein [Hyphomicrobiales bacterium]|nr:NAD(P)-binding domain-containing protein [Hyphomicrobiales bacterium]